MKEQVRKIIDKYYPEGTRLRDIFMRHSRQVADLALDINRRRGLGLDPDTVETAAMLHDIGIFKTSVVDPDIDSHLLSLPA